MRSNFIISLVVLAVSAPAWGQYLGPSPLLNRVEQRVQQQATGAACTNPKHVHINGKVYKTADFVRKVRWEEGLVHGNGPLGTSCYAITTPDFKQLDPANPALFNRRLAGFQEDITAFNADLKHYKVAVPNPQVLEQLTQRQAEVLSYFLATGKYKGAKVTASNPVKGVVGVTFHVPGVKLPNLWIDTRTYTVYILDNGQLYGEETSCR